MRVLLTTWGSTGDLHPFLGLGRELVRRGHAVTFAGNPYWEGKVRAAGLAFVAAGPLQRPGDLLKHPDILSGAWLGLRSLAALMRLGIEPVMEGMFAALRAEAGRHDVLVAHHFCFPAAAVAKVSGIPWVSVSLAPGVVPSGYARPAGALGRPRTGPAGRCLNALEWSIGRVLIRRFVDPPVNRQRLRMGLPPLRDALFTAVSPKLNLQLYSAYFAPPPPDWGADKPVVGFSFWDEIDRFVPPAPVADFLACGDKPWLFTLGTSVVHDPRGFFGVAAEAARACGRRAVLLTGSPACQSSSSSSSASEHVLAVDYLPYRWIMPRVSVVAHQAGIGTVAQALRAGIPMALFPRTFDQPNNAARLEGLGVGRIYRGRALNAPAIGRLMRELEGGPECGRAAQAASLVQQEGGAAAAANAIERAAGSQGNAG